MYRRVEDFELKGAFSAISSEKLDKLLKMIVSLTPRARENYIRGSLKSKRIYTQRWRVRERLPVVERISRAARRNQAVHRRVYNVPAPNCL